MRRRTLASPFGGPNRPTPIPPQAAGVPVASAARRAPVSTAAIAGAQHAMTGASGAPHAPPPAPAGRRTRTPQAELAQPAQQAAERDAHVLVSAGKAFRSRLLTLALGRGCIRCRQSAPLSLQILDVEAYACRRAPWVRWFIPASIETLSCAMPITAIP